MKKSFIVFCFSLMLLVSGFADGNEVTEKTSFSPQLSPELNITKTNNTINIDGNVNEAEWGNVASVSGFSETHPGDQTKPSVKTEVKLTYDENNLYVAFICNDDPGKIRASLRDRDEIWSDDYVGILLDTYGDASWAFFIFSNPLGIQGDTRFSSTSGEDDSFDMIYRSEGQITANGYQVEMAIPFSSLRFPDQPKQEWRINFWRTHPRNSRRTYSWAALNRDEPCFLCQYGTLNGIQNVTPGKSVEILPSVVANQSSSLNDTDDPNSKFENKNIDSEMSLGLKWAVTPSLTVEGTYNPDFSQVESDAAQIDVNNTFALFYPERRPFFQEGSDLFRTWHNVVYTRAINDPVAATKIIGRWKRYTLAYLGAVDENSLLVIPFEEESRYVAVDRNLSNTMRFKRTFGENSYVGAITSDRRLEKDGSGSVLGIDGVFRMFNNYSFEWQVLKSFTTEPNDTSLTSEYNELYFNDGKKTASFDGESFSGDAIYASFERNARHWNVDFDFWQTSPTFRADNGFVNQNNNRKTFFWTGYTFYFNSGWLERFHPNMHAARIWNFDGTVKDEWFSPALNFNLKAQTSLSVQYLFNSENFKNTSLKNINRWRFNLNSNFSEMLRAGIFLQTGRYVANRNDDESPPVRGKGTDVNLWATFKPMQRLIIQPEFSFAEMYRLDNNKKEYSGYILRVRGNYQFTREMFLRLIVQYNDFDNDISIEPLLSYKINPFTVFYVGSRQDYLDYSGSVGWKQTSRQYFLKFQYLFQI